MFRAVVLAAFAASTLTVAALSNSCTMVLSEDGYYVDGHRLDERHEETLQVTSWDEGGLIVETAVGDIRVESTRGPSRIVATVHEAKPGDARVVFENGRLTATTESGDPAAIGDVEVLLNGSLPVLRLSSGQGDLSCFEVVVEGDLTLHTGMGDIFLERCSVAGDAHLEAGMGDIEIGHVEAANLRATTGLGDIVVEVATSADATISSGMGDVVIRDSSFQRLDATTGLGDLVCRRTSYEHGRLDTGLGDVVKD